MTDDHAATSTEVAVDVYGVPTSLEARRELVGNFLIYLRRLFVDAYVNAAHDSGLLSQHNRATFTGLPRIVLARYSGPEQGPYQ